jgi:hypothetical protein
MRGEPLEARQARPGAAAAPVCAMGLEGIVSKKLGSRYHVGSLRRLAFKNPTAPAVRRGTEEDWGRVRRPAR